MTLFCSIFFELCNVQHGNWLGVCSIFFEHVMFNIVLTNYKIYSNIQSCLFLTIITPPIVNVSVILCRDQKDTHARTACVFLKQHEQTLGRFCWLLVLGILHFKKRGKTRYETFVTSMITAIFDQKLTRTIATIGVNTNLGSFRIFEERQTFRTPEVRNTTLVILEKAYGLVTLLVLARKQATSTNGGNFFFPRKNMLLVGRHNIHITYQYQINYVSFFLTCNVHKIKLIFFFCKFIIVWCDKYEDLLVYIDARYRFCTLY